MTELVGCILAGGQSRRMGGDKALMRGGVERLQSIMLRAGISRVIVLCGASERQSMFVGEVWPDPPHTKGVHEVMQWAHAQLNGTCIWLPCDAYLLDDEAFAHLLSQAERGGVPIDNEGRRQPLFAVVPFDFPADMKSENVRTWLEGLPSIHMGVWSHAVQNFNSPDDLSRYAAELRLLGEKDGQKR